MKPVEIRDLLEMDFYGNLQARGKNVLFVKGHADQKNNDYTYDLMLCREGKIYQTPRCFHCTGFSGKRNPF